MSTTNNERAALIDLIAEHLSGTYHCNRVWSAWNVGTMSEDDFSDVSESDTPAELADAILVSLAANAPAAPTHAAPTQAEFALRALVAAGFVTQAKVNEAMTLPGAPPAAEPVAWQCRHLAESTFWQECSDTLAQIRATRPEKWEVRALYTAPPAPTEQWMPIESAPKTHKARLVWCPEYRNIYEVTWCEHKLAWIHFGHGDVMTDTATHWRDLPAPPQGAAKGANGNG